MCFCNLYNNVPLIVFFKSDIPTCNFKFPVNQPVCYIIINLCLSNIHLKACAYKLTQKKTNIFLCTKHFTHWFFFYGFFFY